MHELESIREANFPTLSSGTYLRRLLTSDGLEITKDSDKISLIGTVDLTSPSFLYPYVLSRQSMPGLADSNADGIPDF